MFERAVFETIEVQGSLQLNFEAAASNFLARSESSAANLKKSKTGLCMTNSSKVLIFLSFILFLKDLAALERLRPGVLQEVPAKNGYFQINFIILVAGIF